MCYEFWRSDMIRSEQDEAKKRAQEMIDKAKNAKPAPKAKEPAVAEKEKDTVPA